MNWPDIIQALAAVASVSLAFWIAQLTRRYANSTEQIVKANTETLRLLREELNELREERRAPVRNMLDRFESEITSCLNRGLEFMTADELRETAPRFSIRSSELVKEVRRRDYVLAGLLNQAYDYGAEVDRHMGLLGMAKSSEQREMYESELARFKSALSLLAQTVTAARDRLRRF